jgi:hypothetical protein
MSDKTAAGIFQCASTHFQQGRYIVVCGQVVGAEVKGVLHHHPHQCGVEFEICAS